MEKNDNWMGISLLAFSAIASRFCLPILKNQNKNELLNQSPTSKYLYDIAILELTEPIGVGSSKYAQQILENDALMEKAVKEVGGTLYIYIKHAANTNENKKGYALESISSIYQQLWDCMVLHNNLSLNCVVNANILDSGFISRSELYQLNNLQAIYTIVKEDNIPQNINVEFPECKAFPQTSKLDGAEIYFFEAQCTNVPIYKKVALGGTFDQIHNGHKKLLVLAASICSDIITIGITGDVMLKTKKNAHLISSFSMRSESLQNFINLIKPNQKLNMVELADPFGPTITDSTIEAIVVSSETVPGALKINSLRLEKGMSPLAILVTRRSNASTLSSTFLRGR
jgi:phosphopantetheine adenylyltransferase